jgi:hypothetical protein
VRGDDPPHDSAVKSPTRQSSRAVPACTWMLPWLLPLGLLGTVVLISLPGVLGFLLVGLWGWIVFPYLAAYIRSRARVDGSDSYGDGFGGGEMDYWRTRRM